MQHHYMAGVLLGTTLPLVTNILSSVGFEQYCTISTKQSAKATNDITTTEAATNKTNTT